jgi:hypothetical protein
MSECRRINSFECELEVEDHRLDFCASVVIQFSEDWMNKDWAGRTGYVVKIESIDMVYGDLTDDVKNYIYSKAFEAVNSDPLRYM